MNHHKPKDGLEVGWYIL